MTDHQLSADRTLAIAAAPLRHRAALTVLFALDARLAQIVRTTREPMVGQMRLTWWYEALGKLDREAAPAEPLLQDVQRVGLPGEALATMTEGWEVLLDPMPLSDQALASHGEVRGSRLFALAGDVLGDEMFGGEAAMLAAAGRGWALADLARHLTHDDSARRAAAAAAATWPAAFAQRWPARLRPIGMLALLARIGEGSSPALNALRVTRFRLAGR